MSWPPKMGYFPGWVPKCALLAHFDTYQVPHGPQCTHYEYMWSRWVVYPLICSRARARLYQFFNTTYWRWGPLVRWVIYKYTWLNRYLEGYGVQEDTQGGRMDRRTSLVLRRGTGIQDVWMDMMYLVDREDGCGLRTWVWIMLSEHVPTYMMDELCCCVHMLLLT